MRLSAFILQDLERILQAWEDHARSLLPGRLMTVSALRDHADAMLRFVAADIETEQSRSQGFRKSTGDRESQGQCTGANDHGLTRAVDRFTLDELASEFRALRASVTQMWLDQPGIAVDEARQLIRFNEAIDELLAESISHFSAKLERNSELFTAAIGHDLRNPLNMVGLAVQALTQSAGLSSEDRTILSQIGDAVSRQGRLLDELADFSRARLGGLTSIHRVECDLFDLCNKMVTELRASHPNIEMARLGNTTALADPIRIEQMVSNLVANAVQHGAQFERVTVAVAGTTESVEIAVHNEGQPIAPDKLETIFSPFVRTDRDYDHHRGHLGLGLFIAREIAVAHGASLTVKSDVENGTTFTVKIPRNATR
jgi:signal transduction histidine kinase